MAWKEWSRVDEGMLVAWATIATRNWSGRGSIGEGAQDAVGEP